MSPARSAHAIQKRPSQVYLDVLDRHRASTRVVLLSTYIFRVSNVANWACRFLSYPEEVGGWRFDGGGRGTICSRKIPLGLLQLDGMKREVCREGPQDERSILRSDYVIYIVRPDQQGGTCALSYINFIYFLTVRELFYGRSILRNN